MLKVILKSAFLQNNITIMVIRPTIIETLIIEKGFYSSTVYICPETVIEGPFSVYHPVHTKSLLLYKSNYNLIIHMKFILF